MSAGNGNSKVDVSMAPSGEPAHRNPVQVLWRRRWIVLICLVLAGVTAAIYLKIAMPVYESNAQIYIRQDAAKVISVDPSGGMVAAQNFLQTQCALIRSQAVLDMVVAEPGIRELPSFPQGSNIAKQLGLMVTANVGRRDDLITISAQSTYPADAAKIANAVVAAFTKYQEAESRSTTRELLDILGVKMGEVDRDLEAKRQAMLDFQQRNAKYSFGPERTSPVLDRVAKLSATLTDIQLAVMNAQSAYEAARSVMNDPVKARQLMETRQFKSETAQLRNEVRDLQRQFAGFGARYGPDYAGVVAIQSSLKQLADEMAQEDRRIIEAYVSELEQQVLTAKRNEDTIRQLLSDQSREVFEYNMLAAQYEKLADQLERARQASMSLNEKIKQFNLAENASGLKVSPVESAAIPLYPVKPDPKTAIAIAMVLGALIGAGMAFLRDWLDQRLQSAEEIKAVMGVSVLGAVPHITGSVTPSQRGLYIKDEPMSDVAEAYRTVRTAVYFGNDGVVPKTILVTSPAPGDGKTTLASNLAIAMAQAGNRVLLLDADFRKPTQHKIFEIDKRIGLSNVLAGASTLEQAIHHSAIPGLDVLPCGPIPANPSEILNSQTFADLLEDLAAQYDHVILDSPPVMPVTDARILAASCDATVLALRAHRTTVKGALFTRDILYGVGTQLLGVVVNDIPRRRGLYGYYYGYGEPYQYGYGHQRSRSTTVTAQQGNGNGTAITKVKQEA